MPFRDLPGPKDQTHIPCVSCTAGCSSAEPPLGKLSKSGTDVLFIVSFPELVQRLRYSRNGGGGASGQIINERLTD